MVKVLNVLIKQGISIETNFLKLYLSFGRILTNCIDNCWVSLICYQRQGKHAEVKFKNSSDHIDIFIHSSTNISIVTICYNINVISTLTNIYVNMFQDKLPSIKRNKCDIRSSGSIVTNSFISNKDSDVTVEAVVERQRISMDANIAVVNNKNKQSNAKWSDVVKRSTKKHPDVGNYKF